MTIKCPQCHAPNIDDARFCAQCRTPIGDLSTALTNGGATSAHIAPPDPAAAASSSASTTGSAKTEQLGGPTASRKPLANNALLAQDRYLVLEHLGTTPIGNRYLVQDRTHRRCEQCGQEHIKSDDFCETCGAQLRGETYYQLLEAYESTMLACAVTVVERGFFHRHLVNLRRAFEAQSPDKATRTYVLKDPVLLHGGHPGIRSATRLPDSHNTTLQQTIVWLRSIAELLDHATRQSVLFSALDTDDLLLCDNVLLVDAAENTEVLDVALQPEIAAQHQRHLLRLFQALNDGRSLPASVTAIMADSRSAPNGQVLPLVERLHVAVSDALSTASQPLSLAVGFLSDLGLVREINEDSLFTLNLVQIYNSAASSLHLYAVADGMGGHAAGEVASRLALTYLTLSLLQQALLCEATQQTAHLPSQMLKRAGQEAARVVYDEARRSRTDMGTTLAAAVVDEVCRKVYVINVGDSRVYKINAAEICQITKDHSLVQRLVDSNQLAPEEARNHPNANLIYRTLGEKSNVEIDTFEQTLEAGDHLLLCTDGLCGLVEDKDIRATVVSSKSPQAACEQLMESAKRAGGHDNISAIVVSLHETS